jgi:polysaccharide biosynthesis transport protein
MFEAPRTFAARSRFNSAVLAGAELPAARSADIDILKICATLWRGRMTILSAVAACLALAVLLVLVAPHRFTATTEILIDPVDLRAVANEPTPPVQASETALLQIDSQVRVLTSDDVLRRVVDSQGLAHDPEFARGPSALHALLDSVLNRGQPIAATDPALAALDTLRKRVKVKRDERTYVVDVAVTSTEPAKAARLANAIADAYLAEQTAVRADAARQISQSLTARLNDLKDRVRDAEERAEQFKASHNIVDANGQLVNEQQLTDLDTQLAAARARTAAAKARLDQIEAVQRSKTDIGAFPDAVASPTITALRAQYAEVMRREAEQTTNLGDRHPAVIEIQAQAERLKRMIDDEVNRIALAAGAEYESAKASEEQLRRNVDALKQSALATDADMVTLRELQREVQASRAVYEAFLVRARETGEQERVDTKNIQVISKADLPLNRSSPPSNTLLGLTAVFLGLAAGSGLVLLRETLPGAVFSRRRRGATRNAAPAPAELAPDVPVLAKLPAVGATLGLEAGGEANSRFAAGVRRVYETVRAGHHKRGSPSILILAADGDEDAVVVALTLAATAAQTERVLLIDADVERRTLSAIDAEETEAGLVDVAVGRRLLSDVVIRDRATNINLVAFVTPQSRRDRRIEDGDVRAAFAQTRNFDVVIVAGMEAERDPGTRFFAGLVDHIVLVGRADEIDEAAIDTVVSSLGADARKVRGAVLTGEAA